MMQQGSTDNYDGLMRFGVNTTSGGVDALTTVMNLTSDGYAEFPTRVGIGTTSPGVALEVIGSISGSANSTGSFGQLKTGDIELENERGHWRIIEEKEYLSITNVNTNKKYKFVLEEIE